jgi:hypothetical protein
MAPDSGGRDGWLNHSQAEPSGPRIASRTSHVTRHPHGATARQGHGAGWKHEQPEESLRTRRGRATGTHLPPTA